MSKRITLTRVYPDFDLIDLAVNFKKVVQDNFGEGVFRGASRRFPLRCLSLNYVSVETDLNKRENVILGSFEIVGFSGIFYLGNENETPVITAGNVKLEDQEKIQNLFDCVGVSLQKSSIYRGKAVKLTGSTYNDRFFFDVNSFPEEEVAYGTRVLEELEAHVWALIERPELCEKLKTSSQRKILFKGTFGSGKTLAAYLTARKALRRGWTFVYLPPMSRSAQSLIPYAIHFSARYQKVILLIEDIDHEDRHEHETVFRQISEAFDGISTKRVSFMVLMTTNYPDRIGAAMQRPGRTDKIIDFNRFDSDDIKRLLQRVIDGQFLDPSIDWERVAKICDSFSPAFVRSVAESAKLIAVSKSEGNTCVIKEGDLFLAAEDLKEQNETCKNATNMGFRTK